MVNILIKTAIRIIVVALALSPGVVKTDIPK